MPKFSQILNNTVNIPLPHFHIHAIILHTVEAATDVRKMLKQNYVRNKNAYLQCHEVSTLQKREIKMK